MYYAFDNKICLKQEEVPALKYTQDTISIDCISGVFQFNNNQHFVIFYNCLHR